MKGCLGAVALAFLVLLAVLAHGSGGGTGSSSPSTPPGVPTYEAANPSDPANVHGCDAWKAYLAALDAARKGRGSLDDEAAQIRGASQLMQTQGPIDGSWIVLAIDIGSVATAMASGVADDIAAAEGVTERQAQKISIIASC